MSLLVLEDDAGFLVLEDASGNLLLEDDDSNPFAGCGTARTYIPAPVFSLINVPALPKSKSDWDALRTMLQFFVDSMHHQDEDLPSPGAVQNFELAALNGGVRLLWNTTPNALYYNIYRSKTNSFADARLIATVHGGVRNALSWFDKYGQNAFTSARYYWIEGLNRKNSRSGSITEKYGPLTGPLVSSEEEIDGV